MMMLGCLQDDEDEDSDEDSDDDDTAALLAELEKIKKERAEEQERKVKYHFRLTCLYLLSDMAWVTFERGQTSPLCVQ